MEIPIIKSVYRQQCELPFEYHVHSDVPILPIHCAALRIYKKKLIIILHNILKY